MGTNNVKAKTCLFIGQEDVQHTYMPFSAFTYVTYNPDSRDNNLCDKRILAITNLELKNEPKKMFPTILLELFLPFRPFKKTVK